MDMNRDRKTLTLLALSALLAGAACAGNSATPSVTGEPTTASTTSNSPTASPITLTDPPVVLRLAVSDAAGRPSEPGVNKFIASVAAASGGNITITPTFEAGQGTPEGFELGVANLVEHGDFDLAVVASRAWDLAGVTSLQGLQAPYLIDNDALSVAVAKSEAATRALAAMGNGVVGLTIWPEDLRHLFAFPKCNADFRSPTGVAGRIILWQPSGVGRELLVESLGAIEYVEDDRHLDAVACKLHGQEGGFDQVAAMALNTAVATGNVTLFPKYQILVANQATIEHLSTAQRQILVDAAAAAQAEAIAKLQSEAALSVAWCARGGSVVLADDGQLQAFMTAADPVYARLENDPFTAQLIADIRSLKAVTPPVAGTAATPCSGPVSFVPAPTSATSDGVGFSGDVPPNGTFRAEFKVDGLIGQGATLEWATMNAGVWTWTFSDGRYTYTDQNNLTCHGSSDSVDGRSFHLELDAGQSVNCIGGDFMWKQEPDGIRLSTFVDPETTSAQGYWDIYRWLDRVWIKIQ
jgi:C4-dicarboxylate-binding protein DctP